MIGARFERLLVLEEDYSRGGRKRWKCLCDCGNISSVRQDGLRGGSVRSCGCLRAENSHRTHGMHDTRIYRVWASMISRCSNPNDPAWKYYGGRGVQVTSEWTNFEGFYEDMGEGYQEGLTLERLDNEKDYSVENCVWETWKTQGYNKRRSKNNKSGKTGVRKVTRSKRWQARIGVDGREINLGCYGTFEEAVAAREEAEMKYYGKFKGH